MVGMAGRPANAARGIRYPLVIFQETELASALLGLSCRAEPNVGEERPLTSIARARVSPFAVRQSSALGQIRRVERGEAVRDSGVVLLIGLNVLTRALPLRSVS